MVIFQQMGIFFIVMVIGYFAGRCGRISSETGRQLSWLVVNVANPAMILESGSSPPGSVSGGGLLTALLTAVLTFAFLILCAYAVPALLKVPAGRRRIYRLMTVFSNIGFIGLPILSAAFGKESLLYGSLFIIVYNLLIYTYGRALMEKQGSRKNPREKIRQICNIGVFAALGALALAAARVQLPPFAGTVLSMLSSLTAPLSMLVVGASIGGMKLSELFTDRKILLLCVLKLLVLPALGMAVVDRFVPIRALQATCLVMLATPIGSMTVMFAKDYGNEPETASKAVAVSSMLAVVTLPLLSMIFLP